MKTKEFKKYTTYRGKDFAVTFDKNGNPIVGVKAVDSYYKQAVFTDKEGEFLVRVPNPKFLEEWETKNEAENITITLSKKGFKSYTIKANYQSTLDELKVKLFPINSESIDDLDIISTFT